MPQTHLTTSADVLETLGIANDLMVCKLKDMGLDFQITHHGETVTYAWVVGNTTSEHLAGETVGDVSLEARTVAGAQGKMELDFLKHCVLHGAYQVLSVLTGEEPTLAEPEGMQSTQNEAVAKELKKTIDWEKEGTQDAWGKKLDELAQEMSMVVFPKDKMTTADPVPLRDATQMYQPTRGTGAGSRYFVIGLSEQLKLSARVKGTSISMRVEGTGLGQAHIVNALKVIGLTTGKNGTYASLHCEAPDVVTAMKTIGSLLTSIPVMWTTPMPQIAHIVGKGQ